MRFTSNRDKVLFICNDFRDYPFKIKRELEKSGAEVHYFKDKPFNTLFWGLPGGLQNLLLKKWHRKILLYVSKNIYTYIFVIKGEGLDKDFMTRLTDSQFGAEKIYYSWDSVANYNYLWILEFFDNCFTFDKHDAATIPGLSYLPLFYEDFERENSPRDIDLFTLSGAGFAYRKLVLDKLVELNNIENLNLKFYLINKWRYIFQFFKKSKVFVFLWKPMASSKYSTLLKKSKVVIDIHHEGQSGLTMRSIEALGSGCKLITTNTNILKEQINHDNIRIINRNQPLIDRNFILTKNSSQLDFKSYNISHFTHTLFDN